MSESGQNALSGSGVAAVEDQGAVSDATAVAPVTPPATLNAASGEATYMHLIRKLHIA